MPVSLPETQSALGQQVILLTDTAPADPSNPTKAELNAMLFAQCHIYGALDAQPTQNTGEAPAKACTKVAPQRLGRVTFPAVDIQYSYLPQSLGTPGEPGNEVYETLVPGTYIYGYILEGMDGEETGALDTADVVTAGFKYEVGEYREGRTGTGEFDELSCTQALVPNGGRLLHNYVVPAA